MKVLIATDGNADSNHTLSEAIRLLPLTTAEVTVLAVLDPEQRIGGNENAEQDVADALATLKAAGVQAQRLNRRGKPAEQIVAAAKELTSDLIVIGSAGRSKAAQLVMGSTTNAVLKAWPGAVLVVRRPS
jgi:nucleotide-binding universal stress UspA family protein